MNSTFLLLLLACISYLLIMMGREDTWLLLEVGGLFSSFSRDSGNGLHADKQHSFPANLLLYHSPDLGAFPKEERGAKSSPRSPARGPSRVEKGEREFPHLPCDRVALSN